MQPTTRKRRLALFNKKKPPGRGLPRISRYVMKALAEGETMHQLAKPDSQPDVENLAHDECVGDSSSIWVSQSSQEQILPDPAWREQPSADFLKYVGAATFDSTDLTGWVLRESGDQGSPKKISESSRRIESEKLASTGQANPLILDATLETHIIQENSCHPVRVAATQVGVQQQVVHDFNSSMLMNSSMPVSSRKKNKRKSLYSSKSRKPNSSGDCSEPQTSTPATQIISPPAAERDLFGLGSATQELVQTVEMSDVVENSQPMDLTSLDNRWNDDEIPSSSPKEIPMSCMSSYGNAQHLLTETPSTEVAADSERNSSGANLAKRHGLLSASHSEELDSRSLPKASLTNFSELGIETEVLFGT